MVSYPGRFEIRQGHYQGEECVELTLIYVQGRASAVVAIDPGCFGLALAGQASQPCTITSAQYPPPHGVADRSQDREVFCE
jgi:hypothetical protein